MTLIFSISCHRAVRVNTMLKKPVKVIRGETAIEPAAAVWKQYKCGDRQLPYVIIENDYLDSSTVAPGQQLSHNIIYAMCSKDNKPIHGNIQREIYYGDKLLSKKAKVLDLKPGRWSIGSFIETPPRIKPGLYELKTEFNSQVYNSLMSAKQFSIQE